MPANFFERLPPKFDHVTAAAVAARDVAAAAVVAAGHNKELAIALNSAVNKAVSAVPKRADPTAVAITAINTAANSVRDALTAAGFANNIAAATLRAANDRLNEAQRDLAHIRAIPGAAAEIAIAQAAEAAAQMVVNNADADARAQVGQAIAAAAAAVPLAGYDGRDKLAEHGKKVQEADHEQLVRILCAKNTGEMNSALYGSESEPNDRFGATLLKSAQRPVAAENTEDNRRPGVTALRRIAATKLLLDSLEKKLAVEPFNKDEHDKAMRLMKKLLTADTSQDKAEALCQLVAEGLLDGYGLSDEDKNLLFLNPETKGATAEAEVDRQADPDLQYCANELRKQAQVLYVNGYFNTHMHDDPVDDFTPEEATAIAAFSRSAHDNDGEEARRVKLAHVLNEGIIPGAFRPEHLGELKHEAFHQRHRRTELESARKGAAYALITTKLKLIGKKLKELSEADLLDLTQQVTKKKYQDILLDIAAAGEDKAAIARALQKHKNDLGGVEFDGHYNDDGVLTTEQKRALQGLASEELQKTKVVSQAIEQHRALIKGMCALVLVVRDYPATQTTLLEWHKKASALSALEDRASVGKEFAADVEACKRDVNEAYKYADKIEKGLAAKITAAFRVADRLERDGYIGPSGAVELESYLGRRQREFINAINQLRDLKDNASLDVKAFTEKLEECSLAYEQFSQATNWVGQVKGRVDELEESIRIKFPDQRVAFLNAINEDLRTFYNSPCATDLDPAHVYNRLCEGLTDDDGTDPETLSDRLAKMQADLDKFVALRDRINTDFKGFPEQRRHLLKKLDDAWNNIFINHDKGSELLRHLKAELDDASASALTTEADAKSLARTLTGLVDRFETNIAAASVSKQRKGVLGAAGAGRDGPMPMHTESFHGFREKVFREILEGKVRGDTLQGALCFDHEPKYVRHRLREDGTLVEMDPRESAKDKNIVKVEFQEADGRPLNAEVYCQDHGVYKKGDIVVIPGIGMLVGMMAAKLADPTKSVDISRLPWEGMEYPLAVKERELELAGTPIKLPPQQLAYVYAELVGIKVSTSILPHRREELNEIVEIAKKAWGPSVAMPAPGHSGP